MSTAPLDASATPFQRFCSEAVEPPNDHAVSLPSSPITDRDPFDKIEHERPQTGRSDVIAAVE